MIPGTRSPTGQIAVLQEVPPPTTPRLGGFALSDLGQIYVTDATPTADPGYSTNNGFLFDPDGALCCVINNPPSFTPADYWNGGLPFTGLGQLVLTLTAPDDSTPRTGGIAVLPEGACATGITPPIEGGFSPGYSGGFDATVDS